MKKHLVAQLSAIKRGAEKFAVVAAVALAPAVSFAAGEAAQPDVAEAVAYVAAGIVTYMLIKNSHFLMNAAAYVSNWASRAFGGK
ncbi:hypothetical protein [Stenotrophobium rhamnosiphilum]|uniref:Holin n=1 Tax=Stenotrophobium rhamnosiphilum TaxID=2029166 RepID=A0A2T5MKE3_9GAMM|nr:hypothetical protein [Stenotrophobium rhamnosiphilum]PTU33034.1 hypothetical protein CJD38_02690 [Stenotrophobium rhamnosiphilum]